MYMCVSLNVECIHNSYGPLFQTECNLKLQWLADGIIGSKLKLEIKLALNVSGPYKQHLCNVYLYMRQCCLWVSTWSDSSSMCTCDSTIW